jgi:hypothetical protein
VPVAVVAVEATESKAVLVRREDMVDAASQSGRTDAGCGESSRGDGLKYVGDCLRNLDFLISSWEFSGEN